MVTRTVYTRNKGTGNQVWVFLRYNPTDRIYRIHAGYSHCRPETEDWYSEEREYRLHEYLQDHPEWESKIRQLQEEIESTYPQPSVRSA